MRCAQFLFVKLTGIDGPSPLVLRNGDEPSPPQQKAQSVPTPSIAQSFTVIQGGRGYRKEVGP